MKKKKITFYIRHEVAEALRLFAFKQRTSRSAVVELALEKCIPESYFREVNPIE